MQKIRKHRFIKSCIIAILLFTLGIAAEQCIQLSQRKTSIENTDLYRISSGTTSSNTDLIDSDAADTYGSNDMIYLKSGEIPATEDDKTVTEIQPRYNLTAEEKNMLCFVADCEDNSSIESRQAVIKVIINRVESEKFPDTIKDVLYQKKQFSVMKQYKSDYVPSVEALDALDRILYGADIFDGANALFFAANYVNPVCIAKSLYLVAEIGETKFWGQK